MRARASTVMTFVLAVSLLLGSTSPTNVSAQPLPAVGPSTGPLASLVPAVDRGRTRWIERVRTLVAGRPISVAIGNDGEPWYRHRAGVARPPASNEKLLLSMALLQRFALRQSIPTRAMASRNPVNGVLRGALWVVGAGDPEVGEAAMASLADQLVASGLRRIRGQVVGATTPFVRDWWARGWRDYFPSVYAPIPTALTFRGNELRGRHIADPERLAATKLKRLLERRGVVVTRDARMAPAPSGLHTLASVRSATLVSIMRRMNIVSSNLRAEVLGKYLGRRRYRQPSIDGGARAIESFVHARGYGATAYDSSGLSYSNRVSAATILGLLWFADGRAWGAQLRGTLPMGGQGTLEGRLGSVLVHAKTGTLIDVSALSGWVWLERSQEWAEFSILSSGISASTAKAIENQIVKIVAKTATDPTP